MHLVLDRREARLGAAIPDHLSSLWTRTVAAYALFTSAVEVSREVETVSPKRRRELAEAWSINLAAR